LDGIGCADANDIALDLLVLVRPFRDCAVVADRTGSALPTDPQELYALMYNSNGLTVADLLPWHIKVAYTLFAMECAHVRYCERGAPNWLQG
jgi:hypothetical protein